MSVLKNFIDEIKSFSLRNWWLYVIYIIMLIVITITESNSVPTVILTSTVHFIADIFIMMMFTAYNQGRFKSGSYFQFFSMLIFFALKLWAGVYKGEWHYISADVIYALSAFKNYQLDVQKKEVRFINPITLSLLSIIIIFGLLPLLKTNILQNFWQSIQTMGIFLFGIALSYTGHEKNRYFFSVFSLFVMVLGSAVVTATRLSGIKDLNGLEFSYTILPLTVLVFYLRQLHNYLNISNRAT